MATYTYSLSADFGNQICLRTLTNEINAESAIVATLSYITVAPITNEDDVDIVFTASLSASEETALDNVVASHDGSVCPEPASFTGFTVPVSGVSPTDGSHIATKSYTDSASANALTQAKMYADIISGGNINIYDDSVLEGSFEDINFISTTIPKRWYDNDWLYRKRTIIDHTKVEENLYDFPVLIYLNADSDLASKALSNGNDILFTSSDGLTKLDHEIESYSSGTLYAWVRVPFLSSTRDTVLYLYYGNSGASDQQNVTGVWDSDYVGVWHLDPSLEDSTENSNDGTNNGTVDAAGKIARGRDFEFNETDYIITTNDSDFNGSVRKISVQAWINSEGFGGNIFDNTVASKEGLSAGWSLRCGEGGDLEFVQRTGLGGGAWESARTTNNPLSTGTWYHVAGTIDGTTIRVLINGSVVATDPLGGNFITSSENVLIGTVPAYTNRRFDGLIDEVRISKTYRSPDWLKTEYNNQNSPLTFYSVESEQTKQEFVSIYIDDFIIGTKFQRSSSVGQSNTTANATWSSKTILNANDLQDGKYRIEWCAEIQQSGFTFYSPDVEARIVIDDSITKAQEVIEPQDTGNWYIFSGFTYYDVTSSALKIDLQWRNVGTGTGSIRNARVSVWRVD